MIPSISVDVPPIMIVIIVMACLISTLFLFIFTTAFLFPAFLFFFEFFFDGKIQMDQDLIVIIRISIIEFPQKLNDLSTSNVKTFAIALVFLYHLLHFITLLIPTKYLPSSKKTLVGKLLDFVLLPIFAAAPAGVYCKKCSMETAICIFYVTGTTLFLTTTPHLTNCIIFLKHTIWGKKHRHPREYYSKNKTTPTITWARRINRANLVRRRQQNGPLSLLLSNNDAWTYGIFPCYSGLGQFVSMANTCHDLKNLVGQDKPIALITEDLWMNIMSFVGPGQYLYVASVCKDFKTLYKAYFARLSRDEIPLVSHRKLLLRYREPSDIPKTMAIATDTFASAAFSTVACAEFWYTTSYRLDFRYSALDFQRYIALDITSHNDSLFAREMIAFSCFKAVQLGNLEVLKWLRQQGLPWDFLTLDVAAHYGQLEILQYLHESGCNWDEYTTERELSQICPRARLFLG